MDLCEEIHQKEKVVDVYLGSYKKKHVSNLVIIVVNVKLTVKYIKFVIS